MYLRRYDFANDEVYELIYDSVNTTASFIGSIRKQLSIHFSLGDRVGGSTLYASFETAALGVHAKLNVNSEKNMVRCRSVHHANGLARVSVVERRKVESFFHNYRLIYVGKYYIRSKGYRSLVNYD